MELNMHDNVSSATEEKVSAGKFNAETEIPEKFELVNLYPNPFNPILTIQYNLDFEQNVSIEIYNILGQEISVLLDGIQTPGYLDLKWNGTNHSGLQVSTGIYLLCVNYDNKMYTQKMMFLK